MLWLVTWSDIKVTKFSKNSNTKIQTNGCLDTACMDWKPKQ